MSFNIILALIAVFFGIVMLKSHIPMIKYGSAFLWLLFIPNTIYLFTDIIHVSEQWNRVSFVEQFVLILQYAILIIVGAFTFVYSLYLFEKTFLKKKKLPVSRDVIIIALNFVIAFGIVLGRVQRSNSWEVFTNLPKILNDAVNVLVSPELILLVLFFGVLGNGIYFTWKLLILKKSF